MAPDRRAFLAAAGAAALGVGCASGRSTGSVPANGPGGGAVRAGGGTSGPRGSMHAIRPRPAARRADGSRALRKAVKIGMVAEGDSLTEKFALLKALGFDGVELDSPAPYTTDEVLAARDATGLPVHGVVDSVHWTKPLSHADPAVREEGRAALEGALHHAAAWGASTVLLVPAVVSKDVSYDAAWDRSLEQLRAVVPVAEDLGVAIALENVWNGFLLSPLEARAYVDELASPAVGWYLDVGNLVNFGWPEQWATILGDRILKLDIKEFSRARRNAEGLWKGFEVELLEGDCDWPAVMAALDAVGYTGWATAEIPGGGRERLTDIAARMDRIFAS
jgi:hexulose-6-phosphate isomerase